MTGDRDEPDPDGPAEPDARFAGAGRFPLRRVDGVAGDRPPSPEVRLYREFKGLTVADLLRAEIAERLPGQVRRALHHLERGDLAAADEVLPGAFPPILAGPGSARIARRRWRRLALVVAFVASASATLWWLV